MKLTKEQKEFLDLNIEQFDDPKSLNISKHIHKVGTGKSKSGKKCLLCENDADPKLVELDVELCRDCHKKILSELFSVDE